MGKERLHHPTPDDVTLDRVLGALSDPIRRDVLARIADHGPQFCGDFDYGIAKSTMSYHFKVLRESGLMHTEVLGTHRKITRRDSVIESLFPGLLDSVGLPPGQGQWVNLLRIPQVPDLANRAQSTRTPKMGQSKGSS